MAKKAYIGVNDVARKIKGYIGVESTIVTLKNIVVNGDFSSGETGWTDYGNGTVSTSGGPTGGSYISIYSSGGNAFTYQALSGVVKGHIYYASAYYKKPDANTSTQIHCERQSDYINLVTWNNLPTASTWTKLSAYTTSTIDSASLFLHIPSTNISGNAYLYVTQLLFVDLTAAFGAGYEPSKEWCDANISFFNGTKTIARDTPVNVARKIKKAYVGDENGLARLCWSSYDPVFANNSWADIADACQSGSVPDTWAVGNSKAMTINGISHVIDIIGKNHDEYADGSGTAPLTFQFHNVYSYSNYQMNTDNDNQGGWRDCYMRTTNLPMILAAMPAEVQAGIKAVNKKTSAGRKSSTIVTTADKLFLLSVVEIKGSTGSYSFSGEGSQYAYYAAGNSQVKCTEGTTTEADYWVRSPASTNTAKFCVILKGNATLTIWDADSWEGTAPAFCF